MKYIICLCALAVMLLTVEINLSLAKPKKIILDRVTYSQHVLKKKCEKVNGKALHLDKKTLQAYILVKKLVEAQEKEKANERQTTTKK